MDQSASKTTAFFMLGAMAGAALMALATPRNGREIREKLMESMRMSKSRIDDGLDSLEKNAQEVTDSASDKIASLKLKEEK